MKQKKLVKISNCLKWKRLYWWLRIKKQKFSGCWLFIIKQFINSWQLFFLVGCYFIKKPIIYQVIFWFKKTYCTNQVSDEIRIRFADLHLLRCGSHPDLQVWRHHRRVEHLVDLSEISSLHYHHHDNSRQVVSVLFFS